MDKFVRIFFFVIYSFFAFMIYSCCAFILITSMKNLGMIIGFEQMGDLGIGFLFGSVYLRLMIMKDNEEKDEVD